MRKDLRSILLDYQAERLELSDRKLDRLLGLHVESAERDLDLVDLLRRVGPGLFDYEATPYAVMRTLLNWCRPTSSDVFYDLGAGYGRVVLYGASVSASPFRVVEIVPERAAAAERARKRLGLTNAAFVAADAAVADFEDGTIFFFFSPFFADVLRKVGERLRQLASRRRLRVASRYGSNDYFAAQPWLIEETPSQPRPTRFGLRLFRSC